MQTSPGKSVYRGAMACLAIGLTAVVAACSSTAAPTTPAATPPSSTPQTQSPAGTTAQRQGANGTIDSISGNVVALTTAQGGKVTVDVIYPKLPIVQLRDQDPDATDPFLNPTALDINKGNKQIAHGIVLVLRPVNL